MTTTTNQQGMIAKTANKSVPKKTNRTIKDYITMYQGEIAKALPSVMTPERFVRIATTAVTNTPKLANCTPQSFIGALLNAAQLGLEPNTPLGQAYLIPYGNQCQFQIGYLGMVELAQRAGTNVDAHVVYANDEFDYSLGLHPDIKHVPAMKDRGEAIAYYAVWRNGENFGFEVMSREDVEKHMKRYSKTYSNGPWKTEFDEMAKKTVLKRALKYAPKKTDLARAVMQDETVKQFDPKSDNNMSDAKNDFFDVEFDEVDENTDPVTGEVK